MYVHPEVPTPIRTQPLWHPPTTAFLVNPPRVPIGALTQPLRTPPPPHSLEARLHQNTTKCVKLEAPAGKPALPLWFSTPAKREQWSRRRWCWGNGPGKENGSY